MDVNPSQPEGGSFFFGHTISTTSDAGMLQEIYSLRYQVYCLECGFLPSTSYPSRLESDEYDAEAAHFYTSNQRDEVVGYVRLVGADEAGKFPLDSFCPDLFTDRTRPAPEYCAEISRLMVHQNYRRRQGDTLQGLNLAQERQEEPGRRHNNRPHILLSLYRQMYQHSLNNGIRYWYAAMERSLARALSRMDFMFEAIGPEIDYFGPVTPYIADLRVLEERLSRSSPELLAWFQDFQRQ
jgi:N-acyl amino acid synthase of PEP-CTERM/exosortase system